MARITRPSMRKARGVGLVELMVTLLLGALITAGVISLFNANRQTFRLQDNLALAQETGSFALDFIARDLRRAGYPGDVFNSVGAFDTANTINDRVQVKNDVINGATVSVNYVDDQLAVIYQPDVFSAQTTCTGDAIPAGTAYISNRYWVRTTADGRERELVCQGFAVTTSGTAITGRTAIGQPQALISGVDSFQVLYGVDTTPTAIPGAGGGGCTDSANMPNIYVPGNLLQAAIDTGAAPPSCALPLTPIATVRSVRIALLVRTNADVDATVPAGLDYVLLDRRLHASNFAPVADGRIRRLFLTTVALRNTERVVR